VCVAMLVRCRLTARRTPIVISRDRALFKGVGPRIARSAPQYGVMLLAFEVLQKVLVLSRSCSLVVSLGHTLTTRHEQFVKGEGGTVEPPQMGGAAVPMVVEDRWRFMQQWGMTCATQPRGRPFARGYLLNVAVSWRCAVPPAKFIEGAKELQRIAVGGQGNVWGIGKSGGIFKWTGFEWRKVGGELDYISVGADGAACGVRNGVLYHWDPWDMQFKQMPSAQVMAKVSVGNQSCIWAITYETELPLSLIRSRVRAHGSPTCERDTAPKERRSSMLAAIDGSHAAEYNSNTYD